MGAMSSQCQSCGSALASDQRYCLACGERRGKARFPMATLAPTPAAPVAMPVPPRGPRISSGVAFISFVAVLLMAMGVGVLIGHTNNAQPVQRAAAPQVKLYSFGGSGTGTGASTTASTSKVKNTKAKTVKAPRLAKKVVVKAQAAAAAVLGGKNLPPPTVTVGQKGSGAGYQNGHFTGNFFGGG
jgi:hypothetical protein